MIKFHPGKKKALFLLFGCCRNILLTKEDECVEGLRHDDLDKS